MSVFLSLISEDAKERAGRGKLAVSPARAEQATRERLCNGREWSGQPVDRRLSFGKFAAQISGIGGKNRQ